MPNDYISREAAMDWKVDDALYEDMLVYIPMAQINKHLRSIPSADVRPVVHARWVCNEEDLYAHGITASYRCSECGYSDAWFRAEPPEEKYCGNCGAQMDLEVETE